MTDLHEEQNNRPEPKKPKPLLELLYGLGLSVTAYILIFFATFAGFFRTSSLLIDFAILTAFIFLIVKFFRTGRETAAVTMLVLISPAILIFLMTGACFLLNPSF